MQLHGKGSTGRPTTVGDGVVTVAPSGNAEGWGGREWDYYSSPASFEEARAIVTRAVEGCGDLIMYGFSNGAAFAAKLFCVGETFDGRLVRTVLDDPVPDHAVVDCRPDPRVQVHLYWTGALTYTRPGWLCADGEIPCEGRTFIGIAAYAACLSVVPLQSAHSTHIPYQDAPETASWSRLTAPATSAPAVLDGGEAECP
ncbi:MAG: hypothetical protein ABW195_10630 [Ilumatobacteraceae bacterium]